MLARNQKDSLIAGKNQPGLKEFIYGAKVNPLLFTSVMSDIKNKFGLDEIGYMKLVAYDDDILESAYGSAVFKIESMKNVKSKPALFMATLNETAKANQFKADWPFFYNLCEILGITIPDHKSSSIKKSEGPKVLSSSDLAKIKLDHENKRKLQKEQEEAELRRSLPSRIAELKSSIGIVDSQGCPIGKQFTLPLMNAILKDLQTQYSKMSEHVITYVDEEELLLC